MEELKEVRSIIPIRKEVLDEWLVLIYIPKFIMNYICELVADFGESIAITVESAIDNMMPTWH